MFRHFINLELKSFFRSASVGRSIGIKILLGFLALYFALSFLALGIGLYPLLREYFPDQQPLLTVNDFVLMWLSAELIFRFFMQSLPVMDIKPFLTIPVKKDSIAHFVLLKSLFSFYNLFSLLIVVPFAIVNVVQGDYSAFNMLTWFIQILFLIIAVNYLNFLIKKKFADDLKAFLPFVLLALILVGLDYFEILEVSHYFGQLITLTITQSTLIVLPIWAAMGLYFWNFNYLKKNLYLDTSLKTQVTEASESDLNWTKHLGDIAPFLQLDLKLIWRNKRPKTTVWLSFIFLAYGLLIYTNPTFKEAPAFSVVVGILMTGIFMLNFGQFIPAWDSNYYGMMMSQNIPLKEYLASKVALMSFSVVLLALLSTPYVYFGWHVVAINLACAVYNLGVNIPILLFAGSYNKKRIDLDKSPFMNYQGTGVTQWVLALPLMLFPALLFYGSMEILTMEGAIVVLAAIGGLGLIARNWLLHKIAEAYRKRKYETLNGFKQ